MTGAQARIGDGGDRKVHGRGEAQKPNSGNSTVWGEVAKERVGVCLSDGVSSSPHSRGQFLLSIPRWKEQPGVCLVCLD